jgi:hypothetical protein
MRIRVHLAMRPCMHMQAFPAEQDMQEEIPSVAKSMLSLLTNEPRETNYRSSHVFTRQAEGGTPPIEASTAETQTTRRVL